MDYLYLSIFRLDEKWIKNRKIASKRDSFCIHNLEEITFICTGAIVNFLYAIAIDNFCMH